MPPKIYLIKSQLSETEMESVRAALAIAPPCGTFVFSPEDAEDAKKLLDSPVVTTERPIAIIADFQTPLAVILEDGGIDTLIEGNEQ